MSEKTSEGSGRVRVTVLASNVEGTIDEMARDVRAGLTSDPKDLSRWPKYFYDDEGSRLFEEITALPEYYQTRTEFSILKERSPEIIARANCREIVELGSGSSAKTPPLIEAMLDRSGNGALYSPLDVSEGILRESGERLLCEYPNLDVHGYVGDFGGSLGRVFAEEPGYEGSRLVVFLGGTVGNFVPDARRTFLREVSSSLARGDHLLLGLDLVKDRNVLQAAYDDAAGVTARFNKNLLRVLNERLGGSFDPDLFDHRAIFDEENERIEMWLDSREAQNVPVRSLDLDVTFERGEGLRTEMSHKFTLASAGSALEEADLKLLDLYTDPDESFGLALAGPSGGDA